MKRLCFRSSYVLVLIGLVCTGSTAFPPALPGNQHGHSDTTSYIVQADTVQTAADVVSQAGGTVMRRLDIIDGVVASLTDTTLARVRLDQRLRVQLNSVVRTTNTNLSKRDGPSSPDAKETGTAGYLLYPSAATGAQALHRQQVATPKTECKNRQVTVSTPTETRNLQGWGVTVAVIDSGFMQMEKADDWKYKDASTGTLVAEAEGRCIVYRDFLPRTTANANTGKDTSNSTDPNGHGTHVISTIADNRATALAANQPPSPVGIAPKVNLLVARALDKDGSGTYSDVIAAIEWVIANKTTYNVRVLNLSLYSPVMAPYWADPMNQAVMKAWQSGITVVVAAGNEGPNAATVTAPGNVPYVITVGAIKSGRYTASGADELATYSGRGPTESAFVKPDVLVPASRTIAPMPTDSTLAALVSEGRLQVRAKVDYGIGSPAKDYGYYQLSGTSMAAAEVSGVVALMLQAQPTLSNNQVKSRLMTTARPAVDTSTGQPVYSVWEQGAGLIDTQQAVFTTTLDAANAGMDLNQDLDATSTTHYWGYTTWNEATQQFQLMDPGTGQPFQVWNDASRSWAGASRSWAGASRSWAGASRSWAGASRSWAGGTTTWASSDSLWAGASRSWAGSTAKIGTSAASRAEMLVNDDPFKVMLPTISR